MSTEVLTLTPEFGLTESIKFNTDITESESGKEYRNALWDYGIREYKLTCKFLTKEAMDAIWNFYIARKGAYDTFLIKILTEYQATAENVGSSNGVTTQFLLHNFPVETGANHSCTVGGVANTDYVLSNDFDNEKSYITFNSPPA